MIVDDIVDTAGTLCAAAEAVPRGRRAGSARVLHACGAVRAGPSSGSKSSSLEELVVTDTIPLHEQARTLPKIRVLSVAHLIGEAIRRIHKEESISSLFV